MRYSMIGWCDACYSVEQDCFSITRKSGGLTVYVASALVLILQDVLTLTTGTAHIASVHKIIETPKL